MEKSYEFYGELKDLVNEIKNKEMLESEYHASKDKAVIRSLWTAFCIHQNLEPDTFNYDTAIKEVYDDFIKGKPYGWKTFKSFDNYMCEYLV